MAEYISRKEAINICTKCVEFQDSIENVTASAEAMRIRRLIKELPSADVAEVKYAKDIYMQGKGHCEFKCSLCGAEIGCVEGGDMDGGKFNYCPNCGAKMTINAAEVEP